MFRFFLAACISFFLLHSQAVAQNNEPAFQTLEEMLSGLAMSSPTHSSISARDGEFSEPQDFQEAFRRFCIELDFTALNNLLNYRARLDALMDLMLRLKDFELAIDFDPAQCLPNVEIDYNLPDLSECLDFDFDAELFQCELNLPELNFDCLDDFAIDIDIQDFMEIDQCLNIQLDLPDLDAMKDFFAMFDIDYMIASLEGMISLIDPNFVASLQFMANYCGNTVVVPLGGSCLEINEGCQSECKKEVRKKSRKRLKRYRKKNNC